MKWKFVARNERTGEEVVVVGVISYATMTLAAELGKLGFRFSEQKPVPKRRARK